MIPFVDAHIHLWELSRLRYAWLSPPFADDGPNGSVEAIARDYAPTDYRADLAKWNMVGAVHVDAGADAAHALLETEWLEGLAEETGLPTGLVAYAALDGADAADVLARQAAHGRVKGIRQIVNWHPHPQRTYGPRDVTRDEAWAAGYALLGRHRLSFDLQCYPGQMPGLVPLLERHPEVPVIVNHLGMPVLSDADGVADWRRGMAALAALPHVAVKLSGFGFLKRNWQAADILPFLAETVDLFGTNRCLFASDVPTDKLFASVDQTMETLGRFAAGFSEDEQRDLWGRNANRLYRLGLDL
ncbi:amidohydrolase family protein [Sphingomonas aracearum]|uniref:Amidohydrolase n=1 Tax=Sphingomonas aracearum TaxID=2283317 RepID=A0A369W1R8_9SPHN|nr:amidohydrolase family protein [Sphingomonas aracearum]RDE07222.1 amidohydrolase [Sphingomonas aracearum]